MLRKVDLQSLVDTHERPFVVIDKSFKIVALNSAYEQSYGTGSLKIIGRTCYEVSHGNSRPCFELGEECPHQQVYQTGEIHSCLHIHCNDHGDNHRVRITVYPIMGDDGETYLGESIHELSEQDNLNDTGVSMVGASPQFLQMMEQLVLSANTDSIVLIQGETGTGKELAASFLHHNSLRTEGPFLTLDCTVLTESLFESEVFGHEHGSFTGTQGKKIGLFELAAGGTLFLDEIGELSTVMQAKLLRVLETGEFRRVGGTKTLHADVRVVCATNRDLLGEVKAGTFREDLYYRIACLSVYLPSLHDRADDIPILAETLLKRICYNRKKSVFLTTEAMSWLQHYSFPGNVRELRNILSSAAAISTGGEIGLNQIQGKLSTNSVPVNSTEQEQLPSTPPAPHPAKMPTSLSELEKQQISKLLDVYAGNRKDVADALGISVRTLYRRLKKLGLR